MKGRKQGLVGDGARFRLLALLCATALQTASAGAAPETDPLALGFAAPPNAAKPRVWWHWMSGNVSAEGARLDLDWMRRVGVGGVHAFSGGKLPEPVVVAEPVPFMSPEWRDIFHQSVDQARAADMEFGIAGSPGWSETGGPWVTPADAMKKYVWSELTVQGGHPLKLALPAPPRGAGAFQSAQSGKSQAQAYGDAAVFAYPTPLAETRAETPRWSAITGPVTLTETVAGAASEGGSFKLAAHPGDQGDQEAWLTAAYPAPVMLGAVSLAVQFGALVSVDIETTPGVYKTVAEAAVEATSGHGAHAAPQETLAFTPVVAQKLRLRFKPLPEAPRTPVDQVVGRPKAVPYGIARLIVHQGARISGFEAKAGFEPSAPADLAETPPAPDSAVIDPTTVVDLSRKLRPDGTLDWTPPPGRWTIVRLGWSLTGAVNAPAEPAATGLEVDKLDAAAVRRYLTHYLELYREASGDALGAKGVRSLLTDSWEAGVQNWTPAMIDEFRERRGYDPAPWLPALTGHVVQSGQASDRFLFDFRQTLKDLVVDNHYAVLGQELKARGMTYYTEAQGDYPRAIVDGMTAKSRADIPTAEFWYRPWSTLPGQPPLKADIEEAASAAHIYGKPLVAAEALTVAAMSDPWSFSPAMLKPVVDEIFARGVNRILLHESHMQPLVDAKPGLGLYIFGQSFNRNETWAERAAPWISYLSRTSFMLQQGQYVADVAYFYGEEESLTELFKTRINTDVPKGYAYDYVNPEALLTLLSVDDGRIVTPSTMSYRVLFLPDTVRRLSLPVLRKIRALVAGGAILVAKRPSGGLGLASPDTEVARIADEIWGDGAPGRGVGQGRVYTDLAVALAAEKIAPDVVLDGADDPAAILTQHRRTQDADIYFLSNQSDRPQTLAAGFRVRGRAPDRWNPETGRIEAVGFDQTAHGVRAHLRLEAHESTFVVLRRAAALSTWSPPAMKGGVLATLSGPWRVSFEPGRGAPASASFDHLISWPQSSDPGVRYFSGAATYSREVSVDRAWLKANARIELDLGEVRELASVSVNGKALGTTWRAPYRVDVTKALKPGRNSLVIEVINLWPNRLIGDKQPGADPVAFAPQSPYRASSPLLPSGLLGPVKLMGWEQEKHGVAPR